MTPLELACGIAVEAGRQLKERVGVLEVGEKGARGDLVTSADRESERLVVERLRRRFPHAAILGEEGGSSGSGDERWIVDPLDGTTNYAHGYPLWCVSIAYERGGELLAGAVYAPVLGELYAAERGSGATCNGAPIRVSATPNVCEALVCTGFLPSVYERNAANFARLSGVAQAVRRDGAAALDLCFVAAGRFDAFWERDLKAWDIAAGTLIVREAGGAVTAMDGSGLELEGGSILATNGRLHHEMTGYLTEP